MDPYYFTQDLLDTFRSLNDWLKGLWIFGFYACVLGMVNTAAGLVRLALGRRGRGMGRGRSRAAEPGSAEPQHPYFNMERLPDYSPLTPEEEARFIEEVEKLGWRRRG